MDSELAVAAIAAGLQAVQTWLAVKDSKRTIAAYAETIQTAGSQPALQEAAAKLAALAPPDVVNAIYRRTRKCWHNYKKVLKAPDGEYLPEDIDYATNAVKACICRELRRLRDINGELPEGELSQWYEQYRCTDREAKPQRRRA